MKKRIGSGFLVALTLFCLPAAAQLAPGVDSTPNATFIRDPNTYGTTAETAHTIVSQAFTVRDSTTTWANAATFDKYVTNGIGCCLSAPALLPEGASITAVELEGCDNSATGSLDGVLLSCGVPSGGCTTVGPLVSTGSAATPGCGVFRANISGAPAVNNVANSYFFSVDNTGDLTGNVSLRAARVYYKLQVSPAPGTATFGDVPTTHLFFQYIEALAAAGITSGCGGGNFCPDAAVTRGQMAVFRANALGLHWAP